MKRKVVVLFVFIMVAVCCAILLFVNHRLEKGRIGNDIKITDMFNTVLTKETERFDFAFWEREKDAMGIVDKWLSPNLHVSVRYSGDGYELMITPKDSYFSLYKYYYISGVIRLKGYRFARGGFNKGLWYIYDETGRLTAEEDQDIPFTFNFEDLLAFCERENIKIEKGYREGSDREGSTTIKNYCAGDPPEDVAAWFIYHYNTLVSTKKS
jgi:hypothetical protein